MPLFTYRFTVEASPAAVRAFHHDSRVLPRLSPPPIFIQLHRFEPLAEGSLADFTMWFGPVPVHWQAIHRDVGPHGFRDEQVRGPLQRWSHSHRFIPVAPGRTRLEETVFYEHRAGWRGLLTRLVFNRPALTVLFSYRRLITQLALRGSLPPLPAGGKAAGAAGVMVAGWWLCRRRRR